MTSLRDQVQDAIAGFPPNTPIYMLNLLKFHPTAQYTPETSPTTSSLTGQDAYFKHYIPAFRAVAANFGSKSTVHFVGTAIGNLIVEPGEEWDMVALIRYETVEAFKQIATSDDYDEKARVHREAALKGWKLVATTQFETGA
jgi:hypothetical protein